MTSLPTTLEAPRPLLQAADVLEERERDLRAAQQAAREAEAGVSSARREELLASALARDEGRADPGAVQEAKAREAMSVWSGAVGVVPQGSGLAHRMSVDPPRLATNCRAVVRRAMKDADAILVDELDARRVRVQRPGALAVAPIADGDPSRQPRIPSKAKTSQRCRVRVMRVQDTLRPLNPRQNLRNRFSMT
jgi:hypothetical protein